VRIKGRRDWFAGCVAAVFAVLPAHAQQTVPASTPTPSAPQRKPEVFTLPGVTPLNYSIGPAPTPTPTAAPSAALVQAPPTIATSPRRERATAQPSPTAIAPTPSAAPVRSDDATPAPVAAASPSAPTATATPAPTEPVEQQSGSWFWIILGVAALVLWGIGGWWYHSRRTREIEEAEAPPVIEPVLPPARPISSPSSTPRPAPAPLRSESDPFAIGIAAHALHFTDREVVLEFELLISNLRADPAESIRPAFAMMSANPDQDATIAGFHSASLTDGAAPFDLAAGAGGRMPLRLAIDRSRLHVVEVGGRPMFVPIVLVDLRWRAGLSIRRFGADFMIGTAAQGAKLGPIWLDRGPPTTPLAATRYTSRQAAAA
jgi:hypothetical protein